MRNTVSAGGANPLNSWVKVNNITEQQEIVFVTSYMIQASCDSAFAINVFEKINTKVTD